MRNPSRWTFFAICGANNGYNVNCGNTVPALPFDPPRNFGTNNNIPQQFLGTNQYYYLSRFMFAFYLIALFFAVIALLTGFLALCTRLGAYLSGLNTVIAAFFQALTAALMTYVLIESSLQPAPTYTNIPLPAPGLSKAATPSAPTAKTRTSANTPTASPGPLSPASSSPPSSSASAAALAKRTRVVTPKSPTSVASAARVAVAASLTARARSASRTSMAPNRPDLHS